MEPVLENARDFWGDALDLGAVRFVEDRCARLTGRAFVIHDTIHWPGPVPIRPGPTDMSTVIHELAHCWQHQTRRWQLTRGIIEQTLFTLFGWWLRGLGLRPLYDPYDYGGPRGVARAERLDRFRLEAQATIIEHHWRAAHAGATSIGADPLVDEGGRPTAYARDLARLCREEGIG